MTDLGDKSKELQIEIDRLSEGLGVRYMPVGTISAKLGPKDESASSPRCSEMGSRRILRYFPPWANHYDDSPEEHAYVKPRA